jgi:hypothetical protein
MLTEDQVMTLDEKARGCRLALRAWKDAMGDDMTAIKLLRDWTGLGLREAVEHIQKTALAVGGCCKGRLYRWNELPPELAEALRPRSIAEMRAAQPAEHLAARGVRKIRGAK